MKGYGAVCDCRAISQGNLLVQNPPNGNVVLVVEDEPLILMNAIDMLYEAGFRTVEATSAAEAIAILNGRDDVAAVFTDVQIVGNPDGLMLAHMVRERWPPVGLVVTSGRIFPVASELPIGGTFLSKPYSSEALVNLLRSVIH